MAAVSTSSPPMVGMQVAGPGISMNPPNAPGMQFYGPGQPVMTGAPVILQVPASGLSAIELQQLTSMKALSIMQIICGSLSMLFETAHILTTRQGSSGSGIWCGVFFIVAGILGVVGAAQNKKALFIATLVLSVLSSIALLAIVAFMAALLEYCVSTQQRNNYYSCKDQDYALGSLLLINCGVELVVAIWASVMCCKRMCAADSQPGVSYASQPVYYSVPNSMGSQMTAGLPPTSGAFQQQQALIPTSQYNVNQAFYPQQQFAPGTTNYATGEAGANQQDAVQK